MVLITGQFLERDSAYGGCLIVTNPSHSEFAQVTDLGLRVVVWKRDLSLENE